MRWKCPVCKKAITLPDDISWPIHHCGQRHEFPIGIVKDIPSLTRRAANFATASVKHLATGSRYVDDATRQWRLDQCLSCTQYYDPEKETCSHPQCGCGIKKVRGIIDKLGWASQRCPIGRWDNPPKRIRFVTAADLAADTIKLASILPKDLCAVAGIPRSGMIPASLLATHLHLPLFSLHHGGFVPVGCGWRLSDSNHLERSGPVLVLDDTSMYGGAMKHARLHWAAFGPKDKQAIFATVYCSPQKLHRHGPMPDVWAVDLDDPHFLEWCLFNCGYVMRMAFDLDGIMTVEGTAQPQYLPRKFELPLIVTGRFERERAYTERWLLDHGVRWRKLIMFPGTNAEREQPGSIADYKAKHFGESGLDFFCESEAGQAEQIAKAVRKPVICPAARKVFT